MVAMGLSNFHKKQQLETDLKILEWMTDFSIIEPNLVWISTDDEKEDVERRVYWINGISKGTGLYKETVRKSLERLIERELVWEWPKTKQTRFFQHCFPHWKQHYKYFMKQRGYFSIPIPRVKGSLKKEKKILLNKQKKPKKATTLKELAKRFGMSQFYSSLSD
jgi:hypothetical protein